MLSNVFFSSRVGVWPGRTDLTGGSGISSLVSEPQPGGSGIRWSSLALGGVIAGVIITVAVITVLSFVGNDKLSLLLSAATVHPHESTAEWVGDDATGYASLNLRPGLSELLRARDFFENIVDFDQADTEFDNGLDELSEMLGIDVRNGVLPVLGPELAVAFYLGDDGFLDEPEAIFFAGFMDMAVGRSIVDAYVAKTERDGGSVDVVIVGGLETRYVDEEAYITIHDTEPYVLVATTQDVLEHTLSMMANPVNPLSDDPEFIAAMERLPDKRFVSGYADMTGLTDAAFERDSAGVLSFDPSSGTFPFTGGFGGGASGSQIIAASASVGKNDLRIDYAIAVDPGTSAEIAAPTANLDLIPGDLIGFFSLGGLRQAIDQLFGVDDESGITEDLSSEFTEQTGLDLKSDLLDPIGDELALVLIDLESNGTDGQSPFDNVPRIAAALLVEVDDRGRMEATMDRIRDIAAESDLNFVPVDVAGEQAWLAQIPDESVPLELAYMITDGFFVGGISLESLEQVKLTADGDTDSVKDNDAYQRVVETLGEDSIYTIFVESESLSRAVRSFISPDDMPEFDERFAPWFEKMQSFALTTDLDGDWAVTTMLLTIN